MEPVRQTGRTVDELSLEELEAALEERRRIEHARRFAEADEAQRFRPITVQPPAVKPRARGPRRPRGWRDKILFAVEILALIGLVLILASSLVNLNVLNSEVQAQKSAPHDSTSGGDSPLLPGGSAPPEDAALQELPGASAPPQAPPAAVGVSLERPPALPLPTQGPRSPTRIVIPAIKVDWPIVPGDGWEELKAGVGHHAGSANPGERGNVVLAGHNDVYGEVFKDLEILPAGETVYLYAGGHAYKYIVKTRRVVAPSDVSVVKPTREPVATLITCTPYRVDTMRLVLVAELAP